MGKILWAATQKAARNECARALRGRRTRGGPTDRQHYAPVLETCFDAFGEDRRIFATNWGVCTHFGKVDDVVRIATEFLKSKGEAAWKKAMRENALRVYRIAPQDLRHFGISAGS